MVKQGRRNGVVPDHDHPEKESRLCLGGMDTAVSDCQPIELNDKVLDTGSIGGTIE